MEQSTTIVDQASAATVEEEVGGGGGDSAVANTETSSTPSIDKNNYYEKALAVAKAAFDNDDDSDGLGGAEEESAAAEEEESAAPTKKDVEVSTSESQKTDNNNNNNNTEETDRWQRLLNKETELRTHKEDISTFKSIKSDIATGNLDKVLENLGLTYEQLTTYYLTDANSNTDILSEKFDQFKSEQEDKIKNLQNQLATKEYAEKKSQWLTKITNETNSAESGDRWEVLKSLDNYTEEVLAYQEGVYNKSKQIVSISEAADILEKELITQRTNMKLTPKLIKKLGLNSSDSSDSLTKHRTNFNSVNNSTTSAVNPRDITDTSKSACRARALKILSD